MKNKQHVFITYTLEPVIKRCVSQLLVRLFEVRRHYHISRLKHYFYIYSVLMNHITQCPTLLNINTSFSFTNIDVCDDHYAKILF